MNFPDPVVIAALALPVVAGGWLVLLLVFAVPLYARWREPVFRNALLAFESDDWGAGPLEQAAALARIAELLLGFQDRQGRHPVIALGVILEVPDTRRIAHENSMAYHACTLQDAQFDELRTRIQHGVGAGIFVTQLHGQAHYWPPALIAAAARDDAVRAWLGTPGLPSTEALPAHLQSRWVDASCLPSHALDARQIDLAAADEALHFQACFGHAPIVAVATTFVWTEAVEYAWQRAGIGVIITPGRRATARDSAGRPALVDRSMLTGERARAGQMYLVRDVYFEPALGHLPQRLLDGLAARTRQGRACLVEMHRFNFLRATDSSLAALHSGIALCLAQVPGLRFITPLELARAIEHADAALIERKFMPRFHAWLARLPEIPRFYRIADLSGLIAALRLLARTA